MSQPLPKIPVFRNVVINHECVHAGLADHQYFLDLSVVVQPEKTMLVSVELTRETLIQVEAHQAAEIENTEPDLGFQYQCMDETIVTSEPGRFEMLVHFELSTSSDNTAP